MDGLFVMGQNPAVGAPNSRMERKALAKLKWLVVRDMVETETASFWLDSPEIERGELIPEKIDTEVFFFPAAGHAEKEGCFTNTQRLNQFHEKAVEPPGDARSETWFMYHLGRRLKEKARKTIRAAKCRTERSDLGLHARRALTPNRRWKRSCRKLMAGRLRIETGSGYQRLEGRWLDGLRLLDLFRHFSEAGENKAREREPKGSYGHGWGFAWPSDRRILYNRALRDRMVLPGANGRNWCGGMMRKRMDGSRRSGFHQDEGADLSTRKPCRGDDALGGDKPFIMHPDGLGGFGCRAD